jgi:hypothetical protein
VNEKDDGAHLGASGAGEPSVKKSARRSLRCRIMTPVECIARLCALVPPPRYPLTRFHGLLAPRAKLRPRVVPKFPTNAASHCAPRPLATGRPRRPTSPRNDHGLASATATSSRPRSPSRPPRSRTPSAPPSAPKSPHPTSSRRSTWTASRAASCTRRARMCRGQPSSRGHSTWTSTPAPAAPTSPRDSLVVDESACA